MGWWRGLQALDHRLADRWLAWAESPDGAQVLSRWSLRHTHLADWQPEELVTPVSGQCTDRMQAALVAMAQADSAAAGLTLLVQLRPGLVRLGRAARQWDWIMSHDVSDEVQATFFEVLLGHNLERRPSRIAANLLLDTRQRLWRRLPRAGPPTVGLSTAAAGRDTAGRGLSVDPPWRPTFEGQWVEGVELRLALRDGVQSLPGSAASRALTATMAYRAWIHDEPMSAIAVDLGVAPQTVATRLYRLRRTLRARW